MPLSPYLPDKRYHIIKKKHDHTQLDCILENIRVLVRVLVDRDILELVLDDTVIVPVELNRNVSVRVQLQQVLNHEINRECEDMMIHHLVSYEL